MAFSSGSTSSSRSIELNYVRHCAFLLSGFSASFYPVRGCVFKWPGSTMVGRICWIITPRRKSEELLKVYTLWDGYEKYGRDLSSISNGLEDLYWNLFYFFADNIAPVENVSWLHKY